MRVFEPGDDKVVVGAHAADGIDDVGLFVFDDFNLFQPLRKH